MRAAALSAAVCSKMRMWSGAQAHAMDKHAEVIGFEAAACVIRHDFGCALQMPGNPQQADFQTRFCEGGCPADSGIPERPRPKPFLSTGRHGMIGMGAN